MNYLLFTIYLFALSWLLLKIPFLKNSGIGNKTLIGLFLVKVAAGIAVGWISVHYYGSANDYWDFNRESWNEYQLLLHDPRAYLTNLFTSGYESGYGGVFSSHDSYWNDLRGNVVIKLLSLFNILSRGDYYINSLFFNFLVFFGHVLLYRLFIQLYPGKKWETVIGCFLLPSLLYFSSGVHKDGIVFLMLAVMLYSIYQSLQKNRFTGRRILYGLFGLGMLFLVRSYTCLVFIPAALAWVIAVRSKWNPYLVFLSVFLLAAILVVAVPTLTQGKLNPLEVVVQKQADYKHLGNAETRIPVHDLEPNLASFALNAPQALEHAAFRPYLWDLPTTSMLPFAVELLFYELLVLIFLFFRRKDSPGLAHLFILFSLFFCLGILLLIGFIVPYLGAIVRYRSLYFPFLITPVLCSFDWQRLKTLR